MSSISSYRIATILLLTSCLVLTPGQHQDEVDGATQTDNLDSKYISANLGTTMVLPCTLDYPSDSTNYVLKWMKSTKKEPLVTKIDGYAGKFGQNDGHANRLNLVNKSSLQISHLEINDQGWYQCEVTYSGGQKSTHYVHLTVRVPPSVNRSSPHTINVKVGSNYSLFCEGTGSPDPTVTWEKDGQPLVKTIRTRVVGNQVELTNINRRDGGMYTCTFENTAGSISQPITVVVEGSPYISDGPSNKSVYAGSRVNLPCTAQAYPQQVQHSWFKDDQDLRATNAYTSNRITIDSAGQLVIQVVIKQDRGWYKCRVTNSMGFDQASAYINVVYAPEVGNIQTEVTWAKGYNGQLDCPADSNPPLTEVKWQRNQYELESTGRFDILHNGTLLVSTVQDDDAGHYQCTPINNIGTAVASKRIHVQVKDPPYFVASPDLRYIKNVGENVKMPCEARGLPSVTIQWMKVGGSLDRMSNRVTMTNSYLEIRNLSKLDHGQYECRAINNIATVVKVTDLRIDRTTPHAPFNVTVTPGTFNVTVTWEPAHDGGNTQQYTLWFRRRNQIIWNHMKVSPPGATHNRLYSLQPDTEYEFRIVSTNSYGNSSFSETVRQRTLGFDPDTVNNLPTYANGTPYYPVVKQNIGIPPTPPMNLTARVRDQRIELRWDLPVRSPVRFFTFQIEYLRNMRWVRLDGVIEGETTRGAVINNMGSGTHSLRLVACGTLACSGGSNTVTASITDVGAKPSEPSGNTGASSPSNDDLVLPEALVGGIVGGILFLLVAILLALLAIFHSRKKDRKSKTNKYDDVTYGKPDEMNGRYQNRKVNGRPANGTVGPSSMEEETL